MSENSPVREGDLLAGKYKIERVLGEGGMGIVVAAMHTQLDQRVAIKFLLPDAMANAEVVGRFAREAKSAAKIQSEHVARVIDVGALDNGSPYMVMEYLEGSDLSDVLRDRGPLPVDETVSYVLQACEALAEAHRAGIVHRDLKPSNLYLAKRAARPALVKVLDFGISKAAENPGDAALTRTAAMMGSPYYMSPEQLRATKHVDARSDIWSIGVILYELLTNTRPFQGEVISEIIANILAEDVPPIRERRPDIPVELEQVILTCLQKKVDQRYQNIAQLVMALAPFATHEQQVTLQRVSRVLGPEALSIPTPAPVNLSATRPEAPAAKSDAAVAKTAPSAVQTDASATGGAKTAGPVVMEQKKSSGPSKGVMLGALGGLVVACGVVIAVVASKGEKPAPAPATSEPPKPATAAAATTTAPPATATTTATAGVAPSAAPTESAKATPTVTAPKTVVAPSASAKPSATPPTPPASTAPPATAPTPTPTPTTTGAPDPFKVKPL